MFSTPEVQRLVSGDNAEIDLDDLKYVERLLSPIFRSCSLPVTVLIGSFECLRFQSRTFRVLLPFQNAFYRLISWQAW